MPQSLEIQLRDVEWEIEKQKKDSKGYTSVVMEALEAKSSSLKKKINAKGRRTATLVDGTIVSVGSTVYTFQGIRHEGGFTSEDRNKIGNFSLDSSYYVTAHTVIAVSADGTEIAWDSNYNHKPYYHGVSMEYNAKRGTIFGSVESAQEGLILDQKLKCQRAKDEVASKQLEYEKRAAELLYVENTTARLVDATIKPEAPKLRSVV
jgi:hypothetical protein